jgi:hypothetical protein
MNQRLSSTLLTRAAIRASCRSEFLGSIFAEYVASENKGDRELADMLQVDVGNVDRLRICLRPHVDSFASDVEDIASAFGANATALAQIVRHVDALRAMPTLSTSVTGLLLAARARPKKSSARRKGTL